MKFRSKKVYGESFLKNCPFCGRMATQKNDNGQEVCPTHRNTALQDIKCTCGKWLEPQAGKFGNYYRCENCGNVNANKAQQIQNVTQETSPAPEKTIKPEPPKIFRKEPTETTITSHDEEYFS